EIEQTGTPKNIYEFPISSFVAQFVGSTNLFRGTLVIEDDQAAIHVEGLGQLAVMMPKDQMRAVSGNVIVMSLRPEKIEISKKDLSGFSNKISGVVESIVYHGRSTQYNVRLKN